MNLPKVYEPDQYEADIYKLWSETGAFSPKGTGQPYSIVMPPPNANAELHLGNLLMIAIEDTLSRFHRLKGRRVAWLPGEDHAGFETWVVYEKKLEAEGKSRFDYSRDSLYSQVWDFVADWRGQQEDQFKLLGASADWSKLTFTLDPNVVAVVYETFKKMWDDDLIYRGERIVNYCTKHQTSFSDIEVKYKPEKSKLWYIRYPLTDGSGDLSATASASVGIIVATTRPETMLGDTAVAVHPNDKRYKNLIGKSVKLPLTNREVPIIADLSVDRKFGTGAVKITPAHDPNDFDMAERHDLPRISVIGLNGKITDEAPAAYRDLDVLKAREKVVKDLKDQGFLDKEEEIEHSVGHCYKCGTVIEPLLIDQWFVRMRPLAEKAIEAIGAGKIKFYPASKAKVLTNYLKNLRDWNISRQIPWGIPIPAFQNTKDENDWIFSDKVNQPTIKVGGKTYQRDPDTFDTWFSSGQWPYVTTIFNAHGDLKEFYPTSVMETGHDLLFQWVGRMIMLGLYVTEDVPFENVYLHGMVTDEHGQKMSKSKGNVVNAGEFLKKYGADALRLGLIANRSAGINQAFSEATVVAGRNFCNKLWNIARYVEDKVGSATNLDQPNPESVADHWIINQINHASIDISDLLTKYRFSEAYERLYHVIWDDFADWYIESSKAAYSASTLVWALTSCLKLAHSFAPFVTEAIWQTIDWTDGQLIASAWPVAAAYDQHKAEEFQEIMAIVSEARHLSSVLGDTDFSIVYEHDELLDQTADLVRTLSKIVYVTKSQEGHGLRSAATSRQIWFDVTRKQIEQYESKLVETIRSTKQQIEILRGRLGNRSYVTNAPAELVEQSRAELTTTEDQLKRLEAELANIQND